MEYLVVAERLFEKFGIPGVAMGIATWFVWQIIKPIINNINQSTQTLIDMSNMLAAHNQNALDMHATCRVHGEYLCDYKEIIADNHKEVLDRAGNIMLKLESIHGDVKKWGD